MDASHPARRKRVIDGQTRGLLLRLLGSSRPTRSPADTLEAKKDLIAALTRRLFNHTEHGLNRARHAPRRGASRLRAGNRPRAAQDQGRHAGRRIIQSGHGVFTQLVEIQRLGVDIQSDNPLMRACGRTPEGSAGARQAGAARGRGEEGIDELWGGALQGGSCSRSRASTKAATSKIAETMRDIDAIADTLIGTFADLPAFRRHRDGRCRARGGGQGQDETLRTDPDLFEVWTTFVAAAERLAFFEPRLPADASVRAKQEVSDALQLIPREQGPHHLRHRARVPDAQEHSASSSTLREVPWRVHGLLCQHAES